MRGSYAPRMRLKRGIWRVCAAIVALGGGGALGGCGDSGSDSATASNSDSQGDGSSGATQGGVTEPTDSGASMSGSSESGGGNSDSLSGTTDISGGNSDSLSGTVSSGVESESNSGGTESTGMVSGGGETSASTGETSTGEPVDCSVFEDEATCAKAGCMAVIGRLFFDDGATFCLEEPSFLGCIEQMICDDALTTVCKGAAKYQLPNSCAPPDFVMCQPPPDAGGDGYDDCP